jgi:hypothetical protein
MKGCVMTKDEMKRYVAQIVLHEAAATSTNDRNTYWATYYNQRNYVPMSKARTKHG